MKVFSSLGLIVPLLFGACSTREVSLPPGGGGSGGSAGVAVGGSTAGAGGAAGVAGATGQGGIGGSGGSPGGVQLRADSYRTNKPASGPVAAVPVSPSIRGQDGLLLAQIVYDSSATSNAEDLGFQLVTTAAVPTAPTVVLRIFWKIAAGPAGQPTTEPAGFGVTNSHDSYQDLILVAVYGFDAVAPVSAVATAVGTAMVSTTSSIAVARPGSLGLWWKAGYGSSSMWFPLDWTAIVRGQDGVNDVAWQPFDVGQTGDVTAEQSVDSPWACVLAVFQPPP